MAPSQRHGACPRWLAGLRAGRCAGGRCDHNTGRNTSHNPSHNTSHNPSRNPSRNCAAHARPHQTVKRIQRLLVLSACAAFSGCGSFSADGGLGAATAAAKNQLNKELRWVRTDADRAWVDQRVAGLLRQPLSADDAVQLALLNNRGLQASFFELGIGEAEWVQAGRLPNPGIRLARLQRGSELEKELGLHVNLAKLLLMPLALQMEARRFEQTRQTVVLKVLSLAIDTRKAWVHSVAANESLRYMQQVMQAAQASAELAKRMQQIGNFSKLQRAREQSFYADAALNLARADQVQRSARERLTRLLGLWADRATGPTAFTLPERLPDLPKEPDEQPDIESRAMAQRLDVQAAQLAAEQTAKNLGLTRATGFINVLELGAVRNTSNEMPTQRGWEVALELPLFDWGGARVARAQAVYMQAVNQAAQVAINARSEVREAYGNYRGAYDIARHHRDEIVPLRQRISEENMLRYNGMLIGVFELLADARAQIASVNGAIDALRDHWLARADLDMALLGKPNINAMAAGPMSPAESGNAGH
jgi:outer membrane protein TolC